MFPFMLFIFLCFFGILAVLLYALRRQNRIYHALHDEHEQLFTLLRGIEAQQNAVAAGSDVAGNTSPLPDAPPSPIGRLDFTPEDTGLDLHFDTLEDSRKS
jgi:hypothetical protein